MDIPLLPDIVAIFCLSIGVLLVCHQVKIPPIVGFLLTGVLCGPTALGLVQNPHAVELLAEIGVVLLLFSIGLEMSGEELMRLKRPVFVGGTAQVVLTVGAFMCLGVLTGQTWQQSMMYGFLASLSSTAIVLSRLQQKAQSESPHSPYKNNFILKGGFLISVIVGLDTRATMDLDTTIKGFTLTHEAIRKIFTEICAIQIADDVQLEVVGISDIRETDDYPGIRVALKANYPPISVPLTVDVTTGDMITPREVEYTFSLLFDDRTISILAYNLETVLAEKLETVLSRNIANTRPRDYYDVHILYALRGAECDKATLRRALERTTQKRGSGTILTDYPEIMKEIRESDTLRRLWEKYSREYEYAKDISFDDTCNTIQTIMDAIMV